MRPTNGQCCTAKSLAALFSWAPVAACLSASLAPSSFGSTFADEEEQEGSMAIAEAHLYVVWNFQSDSLADIEFVIMQ
jgi:hypothetical protein